MRTLHVVALALLGCNGLIEEPGAAPGSAADSDRDGIPDANDPVVGPPGDPAEACVPDESPSSPPQQRRLSAEEYANTIADLVGDTALTVEVEDAELWTERGVRQLRDNAAAAVAGRGRWTRDIYGCDIDATRDDGCAAAFIESFGRRAFRRPLYDDERVWLTGVYERSIATLSFAEAMEVVTEVILQSPQLVYLTEGTMSGAHQALTDYELAARLSYLLWRTTPDDELLEAAAAGELTGGGLRAQADRLLDDPRAAATMQRFFSDWLQLDGGRLHHALEDVIKDS